MIMLVQPNYETDVEGGQSDDELIGPSSGSEFQVGIPRLIERVKLQKLPIEETSSFIAAQESHFEQMKDLIESGSPPICVVATHKQASFLHC